MTTGCELDVSRPPQNRKVVEKVCSAGLAEHALDRRGTK